MVKNPPEMLKTWVRSLGWEDPLEKGMVAHSSILVRRIPWTEEPGGLQSQSQTRLKQLNQHHHYTEAGRGRKDAPKKVAKGSVPAHTSLIPDS